MERGAGVRPPATADAGGAASRNPLIKTNSAPSRKGSGPGTTRRPQLGRHQGVQRLYAWVSAWGFDKLSQRACRTQGARHPCPEPVEGQRTSIGRPGRRHAATTRECRGLVEALPSDNPSHSETDQRARTTHVISDQRAPTKNRSAAAVNAPHDLTNLVARRYASASIGEDANNAEIVLCWRHQRIGCRNSECTSFCASTASNAAYPSGSVLLICPSWSFI